MTDLKIIVSRPIHADFIILSLKKLYANTGGSIYRVGYKKAFETCLNGIFVDTRKSL